MVAGLLIGLLGGAAQAGPDDSVVARVGPVSITRGELERRMAKVPGVQLATFGSNPAAIRRAFLEKVLVREVIFAQGAADQKLTEREDVRLRLQDALRGALAAHLRKQAGDPKAIPADEVARYYSDNRDRFQTPERINLWRIQVASKEDAQKIIDDVKKASGDARWKELARERSLDKSTHERGGNLGFVGPDGHSSEVSLKVDAALFEAARKLQNGEVGPEPVAEGSKWAVLWRRGSTPAVSRSLEQEEPTIRSLLARQRVEGSLKSATDRLRQELVRDVSYDGINFVEISASGEVTPHKRVAPARVKATGKPQPSSGPGGLR